MTCSIGHDDDDDAMKKTSTNDKCKATKVELRIIRKKMKVMIIEGGVSSDGTDVMMKYTAWLTSLCILEAQLVPMANSIKKWKASGAFFNASSCPEKQ